MSAPRTRSAVTYLPDAKAHGAEIFTELTVSHVAKEGRHWRVHFAPTEEPDAAVALGRSQDRGALRRHARLDRDPAPLARGGPSRVRSAW